jgi:hypothetical protein
MEAKNQEKVFKIAETSFMLTKTSFDEVRGTNFEFFDFSIFGLDFLMNSLTSLELSWKCKAFKDNCTKELEGS